MQEWRNRTIIMEVKQRTPETPPSSKTNKAMTSVAFIVSVIVHLVIFLLVGSMVIFEGAIPKNLFQSMSGDMVQDIGSEELEMPPMLEEETEPMLEQDPLDTLELTNEMDMTDVMQTNDLIVSTAAPTVTPSFTPPTMTKLTVGSESGTKIATGLARSENGKSGPGVPRTANIFGRQVAAAQFGAVLDVSYSTHKTIDKAIKEIETAFPDAILVVASGCGMSYGKKSEMIEGGQFAANIEEYEVEEDNFKQTLYLTRNFRKLLEKNKNFEKMWRDATKEKRAYALHVELPDRKSGYMMHLQSNTQDAFTFLENEGCDAIYWLADFEDGLKSEVMNDLEKKMEQANVKIIAHNFDGESDKDKDNLKLIKKLVQQTNGQLISGAGK